MLNKQIIDFLNSHQGFLELSPEDAKQVLASEIYNKIPDNIADIVDDILKIEKTAKFKVGNEGSRVLYVSFYAKENAALKYSCIESLGYKYNADEVSTEKINCACSMVLINTRMWWD